jgi:hypothetical protein
MAISATYPPPPYVECMPVVGSPQTFKGDTNFQADEAKL